MSYPLPRKTLVVAVCIALAGLLIWELHWRAEGQPIGPNDDKHLWAAQRAKLGHLDSTDVVLIGSSRVFFDFQLDVWEEETGIRPVMLAIPGSSPTPVLLDIANQSEFAGTVVMGITPPLFFSPPSMEFDFWAKPSNWVEHYHQRTYADRFSHWLSLPLQNTFAFLENTEENFYDELDLRTQVYRIPMPLRVMTHPPFPSFQYINNDRNVTMRTEFVEDTARAREVKNVWMFFTQPPPDLPPPEVIAEMKMGVIGMAQAAIGKIRERGGQVILVRCPSSGAFRAVENGGFPREENWDKLVDLTACPAYHFEDYPFMNKYIIPEWSHLATPDAKTFTRDMIEQFRQDGLIK